MKKLNKSQKKILKRFKTKQKIERQVYLLNDIFIKNKVESIDNGPNQLSMDSPRKQRDTYFSWYSHLPFGMLGEA